MFDCTSRRSGEVETFFGDHVLTSADLLCAYNINNLIDDILQLGWFCSVCYDSIELAIFQ